MHGAHDWNASTRNAPSSKSNRICPGCASGDEADSQGGPRSNSWPLTGLLHDASPALCRCSDDSCRRRSQRERTAGALLPRPCPAFDTQLWAGKETSESSPGCEQQPRLDSVIQDNNRSTQANWGSMIRFHFELTSGIPIGLRRSSVFTLNRLINFLAMDRDVLRSLDSQTNLVAPDIDDGDDNVIPDHDAFVAVP